MDRLKIVALAILLGGSVALGLAACQDADKDQTRGANEGSGPSDAARGPGNPANPANPQGPSGPPAEKAPSR